MTLGGGRATIGPMLLAAAGAALVVGVAMVGGAHQPASPRATPAPVAGRQPTATPVAVQTVRPTATQAGEPAPQGPGTGEVTAFDGELGLAVPASSSTPVSERALWVIAAGVRMSVERWDVGTTYLRTIPPGGTISGRTLAELADAVDGLLAASLPQHQLVRVDRQLDHRDAVEWVTRARPIANDGSPMAVDLVVAGSEAFLFAGYADDGTTPSLSLVRYQAILGSANFLRSEVRAAMGGRISFLLDGGSHVTISTNDELEVVPDGPDYFQIGPSRGMHAWRSTLGEPVTVRRPGGGAIVIRGATLDELGRSLTTAPSRFGAPLEVLIDGRRGLRWVVTLGDLGILGPVRASITLVIVGKDVFVLTGQDGLVDLLRFVP